MPPLERTIGIQERLIFARAIHLKEPAVSHDLTIDEIRFKQSDFRDLHRKIELSGEILKLLLGVFAVGDVCIGTDNARRLAIRLPLHDRSATLDPNPTTATMHFTILKDAKGSAARVLFVEGLKHMAAVFGMYGLDPVNRLHLQHFAIRNPADPSPIGAT